MSRCEDNLPHRPWAHLRYPAFSGTKYSESKLKSLIYGRDDVPSEFKYPEHGLLHLRQILTTEEVKNPNSKDSTGDPTRRVLKDGYMTGLTVGCIGKFMSFVRKYFLGVTHESIELPIFNHEEEPGTFSKGGDSGSAIVDISGRFVGLVTGGSNKGTNGSDITYATPFEWVWEFVCKEFPGAVLYFDDLPAFFAIDIVQAPCGRHTFYSTGTRRRPKFIDRNR